MPDLSRRDAFRLVFGKADRIAMEKEQDSALDVMRAAAPDAPGPEPASPAAPAPAPSRFARFRARVASLFRRGA
jgi:hypothetical protein